MKRHLSYLAVAAVAAAIASGPATADAQTVHPWSVSFDLGSGFAAAGDVHGGAPGTVLSLPTEVEARSYGDVYEPGLYWAAGIGYRVSERGEIRVQGSYKDSPAERLQVGSVAGLPLFGLFDDYRAFGMDVGYRHYLADGRAQPFVGGSVGFMRLDRIRSEFSVPDAGVVLSEVDFFESSTVPAFAVGGGVQVPVTSHVAIQGGVDLRWHGDFTDRDGLAGTGLESINDESRRWSLPVTGGVTVRF